MWHGFNNKTMLTLIPRPLLIKSLSVYVVWFIHKGVSLILCFFVVLILLPHLLKSLWCNQTSALGN